jgi:hypothetical protein
MGDVSNRAGFAIEPLHLAQARFEQFEIPASLTVEAADRSGEVRSLRPDHGHLVTASDHLNFADFHSAYPGPTHIRSLPAAGLNVGFRQKLPRCFRDRGSAVLMTVRGWIPECLLREPPVMPPAKL